MERRRRRLPEPALTAARGSFTRLLGSRFWEFSALLSWMRALRELHGLKATSEIETAIAEAAAWLEMTGAKSYGVNERCKSLGLG